jgi:hypothetical protein
MQTSAYCYKKRWIKPAEMERAKVTLRKNLNIPTGTITKLRRNEEVALAVLRGYSLSPGSLSVIKRIRGLNVSSQK